MTVAGIYARKSNEQSGVPSEEKSVASPSSRNRCGGMCTLDSGVFGRRSRRARDGGACREAIAVMVLGRIAEWRTLLTKNAADGRELFRQVLDGRLTFTPDGRQYRFKGAVMTGKLIAGKVGVRPEGMASPAGFEPAFWP
jgi:hypothetical protein